MSVYSVEEADTVITVCSSITEGCLDRAVTVGFTTADGAARGIAQCVGIWAALMFIISCTVYMAVNPLF